MNFADFKHKLHNFLTGDLQAEVETMLRQYGYGKIAQIRGDVAEYVDLVASTGKVKDLADMIRSDKSLDDIRREPRSGNSGPISKERTFDPGIIGKFDPTEITGKPLDENPLVADAMRRAARQSCIKFDVAGQV